MPILHTYLRALAMLRPEARAAALLCVANVALAAIHFLEPLLFGRVIELLTHAAAMSTAALWAGAAAVLGLWAAVGLFGIGAGMTVSLAADRMAHRVKMREQAGFYTHALALPLSFHGAHHSGGLMRVMLAGTDTLFGLWLGFFRDHLVTFLSVLVLLPLTLLLNWRLAIALILLAALFCALTAAVITRTEEKQRRTESFHNSLASTAHDALSNVAVVHAFATIGEERQRFAGLQRQVLEHQFPVLNWWALVSILTRSASTVAVLAMVALGTVLHVRGEASVGEIVTFMGFATMLVSRLEAMMWFVTRLFAAAATLGEYFAVLDEQGRPDAPGAVELAPGPGEIAFEEVGFAYPGAPAVLSGISFVAAPGSVTALVGHTGAGKTTAMALLQRLWEPTRGRITVDGQDIGAATLASLRARIGVVFQDSLLFNRSIRENLLVGKPDATDAEIEHACRLAEAHDFIMRQPQGYDTMVGERGVTLSGGQKQRLAIARALLRNPPILILDEATSALDSATEAKVVRALRALMAGRTTFVIAHRLSTVREADQILVFEGGRIVERGDFTALLRRGGLFASLVATQLAPAEPEAMRQAA